MVLSFSTISFLILLVIGSHLELNSKQLTDQMVPPSTSCNYVRSICCRSLTSLPTSLPHGPHATLGLPGLLTPLPMPYSWRASLTTVPKTPGRSQCNSVTFFYIGHRLISSDIYVSVICLPTVFTTIICLCWQIPMVGFAKGSFNFYIE